MQEPPPWLDRIAYSVIAAALDVHRVLGPGLGEAVYEEALCLELGGTGLPYARRVGIPLRYRDALIGQYIADLVVDGALIVELKSVERLAPIHHAQLRSYLRAPDMRLGLLVNFNVALLKDGIQRVVCTPRP